MKPIYPINESAITHPLMCSDGYMYEEICLEKQFKLGNRKTPIKREVICFIKPCGEKTECFNFMGDENKEEIYTRTIFFPHRMFGKEDDFFLLLMMTKM